MFTQVPLTAPYNQNPALQPQVRGQLWRSAAVCVENAVDAPYFMLAAPRVLSRDVLHEYSDVRASHARARGASLTRRTRWCEYYFTRSTLQ